jgi:pilus assembly protein Flp/PilA
MRIRLNSQKGVTMIEYALIAALISTVTILALSQVGQNLVTLLGSVVNAFSSAPPN